MNVDSSANVSQQQQSAAIEHIGAPARLLAGPGTGKTWAMTQRAIRLVQNHDVLPPSILVLTFTRAAAQELRGRLRDAFGAGRPLPRVATLHSYALRQLLLNADRLDSLPMPLRIADDWEERHIVLEDVRRLQNEQAGAAAHFDIGDIRAKFQDLSADWETLNADREDWERTYPDPAFLAAWHRHRALYGYTLRSELVYQLKRALWNSGNFKLEFIPDHILVDEYQDLNACDLKVVEWIADHGAELFAAGDDDQSIYGFRQAAPVGIRTFLSSRVGAVDLRLEVCRRCAPEVLRLAEFVIALDLRRVPKVLRAEDGRRAGVVKLARFASQDDEAAGIAERCRKIIDGGTSPGDILILLRQDRHGAFSSVLANHLLARGLPVHVDVGGAGAFDSEGGRTLLALLRLAHFGQDGLAWRALLQLDKNNLGTRAVQRVENNAIASNSSFGSTLAALAESSARDRLAEWAAGVARNALEIARLLEVESVDYEQAQSEFSLALAALPIPSRLRDVAGYEAARRALVAEVEAGDVRNLAALLSTLGASRDDEEPVIEASSINVLTMHKAKGLGADTVFVAAAEDEYLPGRAAGDEVDDERRLLYVSLTRARERLYITYCDSRRGAQLHSGRNSGRPTRTLTRFLRDGPLTPGPLD